MTTTQATIKDPSTKTNEILNLVDEADIAYQTMRHLVNVMRAREELPEAESGLAFGFIEHIDASSILMTITNLLDKTKATTYQLFELLKKGAEVHSVRDPVFAVWDELQRKKDEQSAAPEDDEIRNSLFKEESEIQDKLFSTPAFTPEGVKLQIRRLFDFMELLDPCRPEAAYLRGLEASLDNLQSKAGSGIDR